MGKAFEKQIKTIEDQVQKQVKALEGLESIEGIFAEGYKSVEIKNKVNKIKEFERKKKCWYKQYGLLFKQRTIQF